MNTQQLQILLQPIIKAILDGRPVEDTRIEVKSVWIDHSPAAHRLAGHANASRGEPIIWILGIDEKKRKVTGVDTFEMDNWIKAVEKYFDGEAPALVTHTNIHIEDKTIVALYFETHLAAPFVVKNSEGGYPQFTVPWRSATRLRAAKREEIIEILRSVVRVPEVRIMGANLTVSVENNEVGTSYPQSDKKFFSWKLSADLYFTPQTQEKIVIPYALCYANFRVENYGSFRLPIKFSATGESATIVCAASELVISGAGSVRLEGVGKNPAPIPYHLPKGRAVITTGVQVANSDKLIVREMPLKYTEKSWIGNLFTTGSWWTS